MHLCYGDRSAGERARELLPAVRLAATLALRATPDDYWAAASLAECALHESLMSIGDDSFADAYRAAGALRPRRGDLDATLFPLEFLAIVGLLNEPIAEARRALLAGAGARDQPDA